MLMISSLINPKVKYVRRLQADRRFRAREKLFVIEGSRWLKELLKDASIIDQLFFTADWQAASSLSEEMPIVSDLGQQVSAEVMASISATETPPGVLAVVSQQEKLLPAVPTLYLILDGVTNPGNLGTMLRTAGAAGVEAVLLAPGCVDVYNPKVVRGGMGAHLRLPLRQWDWSQITTAVSGLKVWLAEIKAGVVYTAVDWRKPSALIIGNEAHGASPAALQLAAGRVTIPMHAQTESLNAAVAAGVILFEAARQRHNR